MKKVTLIVACLLSGFILTTASAQVRVRLNINVATQPVWGPTGYDHVEYYYMPDIDAFYYVPRHQYIYQEQGRWIFTTSLPSRFGHYNFDNGYKVVINDDPRPYRNAANYRVKYSSYRDRHDQEAIRNSRDSKYFVNKNHPEHNRWRKDQQRRHNH